MSRKPAQPAVDIFELDNFPIHDDIIKGAKEGNPIDILHIQLRGFSILNFSLNEFHESLKCHDQKIKKLERNDKIQDKRIKALENKVEEIKKKIA